jgi:hypothetical protein
MMMAATKWVRVARVMMMAMRVLGNEEGQGDEEDDGVDDEGGVQRRGRWRWLKERWGNKGDRQATATRVMVTAKGNNNQPAMGATKAGGG